MVTFCDPVIPGIAPLQKSSPWRMSVGRIQTVNIVAMSRIALQYVKLLVFSPAGLYLTEGSDKWVTVNYPCHIK